MCAALCASCERLADERLAEIEKEAQRVSVMKRETGWEKKTAQESACDILIV